MGILTVGVVTKPFHFEGQRRMRIADDGITELHKNVDTLLIIPNQNLFRVANEKTTFADAFAMADQVLYSGVACITDLMVKEGLINLDFADVRTVMREMGKAMMGTGEAEGDKRALTAAEAAISNPLIDEASMKGARGLLISITGGRDLTLYEVDEAATRIREEVDQDANIIVGATFDESLDGIIRVSVVATGIDHALTQRAVAAPAQPQQQPQAPAQTLPPQGQQLSPEARLAQVAQRLRVDNERLADERHETMKPAPAMPQSSATDPIESAKAAMAAAIMPQSTGPDVTIRPLAPKPSLFIDPPPAAAEQDEPETFIPPQPERVPNRTMRMPRIDELPVPAQNEIRARRGEYQPRAASSREAPHDAAATARGRRPRPSASPRWRKSCRRRPAAPRCLPPPPSGFPAVRAPRSDSRPEPVSGICQARRAAGSRPAWPAGPCA